jgi:hypothetical protein
MNLKELLSEKKSVILSRWADEVLSTYQPDASNFIKKNQNRFANPVGHTVNDALEKLFNALLSEAGPEEMAEFLDYIVRIRAVQDFTPSQAVSFVFTLKTVIRDELAKDPATPLPFEEIASFEKRVDDLALVSFDIYMKCREKLYDIKANELNKMTYRLLKRANMICGESGEDAVPGVHDGVNIKQEEVTK